MNQVKKLKLSKQSGEYNSSLLCVYMNYLNKGTNSDLMHIITEDRMKDQARSLLMQSSHPYTKIMSILFFFFYLAFFLIKKIIELNKGR